MIDLKIDSNLYVRVSDKRIASTQEVGTKSKVIVDFDDKGDVVGVEFLSFNDAALREYLKEARPTHVAKGSKKAVEKPTRKPRLEKLEKRSR